jgi:hypothetical protein
VTNAVQPVLSEDRPHPTVRSDSARYVRSLLRMRLVIGILGVALPVLLVFIDWFAFEGDPVPRGSLSAYYYSGMREVFVATLAATGIFLISYRVADRISNTLTNIAGGLAICIALFPTGRPSDNIPPLTPLQDLLTEQWVTRIHYGASAFFIGFLGVMSLFFGIQEGNDRKDEPGARFFRWYHWACTLAIAAAGGWILVAKYVLAKPPNRFLLYGEIVSAFAFGFSWLLKGIEIDKLVRRAPIARLIARTSTHKRSA